MMKILLINRIRLLPRILPLVIISAVTISCSDSKPESLYQTGMNYFTVGKLEEAVQSYNILLRSYPNSEFSDDALFNLANIYNFHLNNQHQAAVSYQSLIDRHVNSPYYPQSLKSLANIYLGQDDYKVRKAIALLERFLLLDDISTNELVLVHLQLANASLKIDLFDDARSNLKQLILAVNSDSDYTNVVSHAYFKLGLSYEAQKYNNLALIAYQEAEDYTKGSVASLHSAIRIAEIYEERSNKKQARKIYRSILDRLNPNEPLYAVYKTKISS